MAGIPRLYYRNYSTSDTTHKTYGNAPGDPFATVSDLGWNRRHAIQKLEFV